MPYYGSYINYLYHYPEIIGSPTILTYLGQNYHSFYIKTNTESGYLHPVISYLRVKQRIICKCCGLPGYKADYCITISENLLHQSLCRNNNQFNAVDGYAPHEPPK